MAERVLLKSRDATASSSSTRQSYAWILQSGANVEGRYRVASVSMPNNLYNVVAGINDVVYTSLGNATLTPGYYTASTFTTMLQVVLRTAQGNNNFTTAYSSDTKKITISNVGAFTLNFATTTASAAYLLGFANANTSSATSQVGDYPVNLIYTQSLAFEVSNSQSEEIVTSGSGNTARGHIYVAFNAVDYGYYFVQTARDITQYVDFSNPTNRIQLNVWDSYGNPLSLMNADFEILLEKAC